MALSRKTFNKHVNARANTFFNSPTIFQFRRSALFSLVTCAVIASTSASAVSKELKYIVGVDTETVFQDVYSEEERQTLNSTNYILRPRLSLSYKSKRADLSWSAVHNHVRRGLEELDVTNNYTNYRYRGEVDIVENLLSFNASGALNYQNAAASGFLVDNFLLNAENLSKTRSNRLGLDFTLPRGDYFGHQTLLTYSITESERRENTLSALDSNVFNISTSTFTGDNFERFSAQVQTNFSVSDRTVNGDYTSRQVTGDATYRLYSNLGFTLTGRHEANQIDSEDSTFSQLRDFNSLGAGITWRQADNKRIALTWNRADSEAIEEDEDNEGFIGLDVNWAFTPRTQITADYTRRFFGESASLSFQHRIKRLRTQVRYTEEVTSFSRLIADPENLGVFVCADGINDLAACFQPNSLNYQLAPNEAFVQFSQQNSEINDELILRKGLSWQLGTELRRTRVSVNGRYATNEYLESDRLSRTYSAGTSVSFQIGRKTNINWTTNAAFTDDILAGERGESQVYTTKLGIKRAIGRYFDLALDLSYLERETEGNIIGGGAGGANLGGLRGDVQDRRISLSLQYRLSK